MKNSLGYKRIDIRGKLRSLAIRKININKYMVQYKNNDFSLNFLNV